MQKYDIQVTGDILLRRSDIAALKDIVRRELPRLHARAAEVGMPLELKLTQWLVVAFINCFPPHVALRILEVSEALAVRASNSIRHMCLPCSFHAKGFAESGQIESRELWPLLR